MKKIQYLLFSLLFPILLYGKGNLKDTITIRVNGLVYELTASLDSTGNQSGTKQHSAICVRLMKQGKIVEKSIFPLSNRCPIEEDIRIEGSDCGFIIRIPYCDGYLFRFGKARFVYSKGQDDFILTAYEEEIIDRQHPERENRSINYDLPENRITLSGFSPCTITNKMDTLYYKNDTISQELIIRRIDEKRIYFVLSSQKIHNKQKDECKGYASISDYAELASETDYADDGSLYPVIEYWCEDEDLPLSIRTSHDYSRATISFSKELSLPFIYPLRKEKQIR